MNDLLIQIAHLWETARYPLGAGLCLIGALLCCVGTVGVLRFPDVYTRLHAASITDTSGATVVLIGMACLAPSIFVTLKLVTIFVFLYLTSPASSHALANAAHTAGLQPLIGRIGKSPEDDE